jgi:acetoin utilization deacetylase AcuC-like enzyme
VAERSTEAPRAALVLHADCGRHDTGWGHPEHQGRLPAIVRAIEHDTPALLPWLRMHEARPAQMHELLRVHTTQHVDRLQQLVRLAADRGQLVEIEGDTVISPASWDAAVAAAGCAIDAGRLVASGETATAFALCRPPGHHATAERMMGFCLLNNVALAVRAVQAEFGLRRNLIVDWDVHHGNGTQDIFLEDPDVYYLSLHQWPWYPGTGAADERGAGAGRGMTRNVPVAAGTGRGEYLRCFEAALAAALVDFSPEFIFVSAGYDCMAGDPLGDLLLEPADLHAMTSAVLARTRETAGGRVACVLEGGYSPHRVGAGVIDTLRALCGLRPAD